MRVRCGIVESSNVTSPSYIDCFKIYKSIMKPSSVKDTVNDFEIELNNISLEQSHDHPCVLTLEALARGVVLLADGSLEGICTDVHMRVVCASNYEAFDPMFHMDKCPLSGYVLLTGPGTEYMDRTCTP